MTDGQFNSRLEETEPTFKSGSLPLQNPALCVLLQTACEDGVAKRLKIQLTLLRILRPNGINEGITFTIPDDLKPTLTSEKKKLKIKPKTSTSTKENQAEDSPKLEQLLAIIAEEGKKQKELEESLQKTNETIASVLSAIKTCYRQPISTQSDTVDVN